MAVWVSVLAPRGGRRVTAGERDDRLAAWGNPGARA